MARGVLPRFVANVRPALAVCLGPLRGRPHGGLLRHCVERVGGVATSRKLARDEVAASASLAERLEATAVGDRVGVTAEAIADLIARTLAGRDAPGPDRRNADGPMQRC
jgi:hypothetical protein